MTSAERPELAKPETGFDQISDIIRAHIPEPHVGGRADTALTIQPILQIAIPTEGTVRRITITATRYPTDQIVSVMFLTDSESSPEPGAEEYQRRAEKVLNPKARYTIADSAFPERVMLVDSQGVFFAKIDQTQGLLELPQEEVEPQNALKVLPEEIGEPGCKFSYTFHIRRREGMPVDIREDEKGVHINIPGAIGRGFRKRQQPGKIEHLPGSDD